MPHDGTLMNERLAALHEHAEAERAAAEEASAGALGVLGSQAPLDESASQPDDDSEPADG